MIMMNVNFEHLLHEIGEEYKRRREYGKAFIIKTKEFLGKYNFEETDGEIKDADKLTIGGKIVFVKWIRDRDGAEAKLYILKENGK